jgi:hypothetical protein
MSEAKKLDWMSILIEKDLEQESFVDYVFISNVHAKDPRYKDRYMLVGQNRGLFRINKESLEIELLLPMEGDNHGKRFHSAASKILREYNHGHLFPAKAHFACG